ncbi:MAG: YicC/YloC family endoribonuclease [Bacteroidota bacterium]
MNSMTGFGRGTAAAGTTEATVELRSVNNRYCEVSVRLPGRLNAFESRIQNALKAAFTRGRIQVQVQIAQQADEAALPISVDVQVAAAYGTLLRDLRAAAGLDAPVTLADVLTFSDVFEREEEPDAATEDTWAAIEGALAAASDNLRAMRAAEGDAMQRDLAQRLAVIEAKLDAVETHAPERVTAARQRLHERLGELLDDERLDRDRLEVEIAILADKLDITEEIVRLRSHLDVFRQTMDGDKPAGRKLNFLTQEMNREINTIGSKANDTVVSHLAVEMKEALEQIREQVQNVE